MVEEKVSEIHNQVYYLLDLNQDNPIPSRTQLLAPIPEVNSDREIEVKPAIIAESEQTRKGRLADALRWYDKRDDQL